MISDERDGKEEEEEVEEEEDDFADWIEAADYVQCTELSGTEREPVATVAPPTVHEPFSVRIEKLIKSAFVEQLDDKGNEVESVVEDEEDDVKEKEGSDGSLKEQDCNSKRLVGTWIAICFNCPSPRVQCLERNSGPRTGRRVSAKFTKAQVAFNSRIPIIFGLTQY